MPSMCMANAAGARLVVILLVWGSKVHAALAHLDKCSVGGFPHHILHSHAQQSKAGRCWGHQGDICISSNQSGHSKSLAGLNSSLMRLPPSTCTAVSCSCSLPRFTANPELAEPVKHCRAASERTKFQSASRRAAKPASFSQPPGAVGDLHTAPELQNPDAHVLLELQAGQ